jgi:hypothetical protein
MGMSILSVGVLRAFSSFSGRNSQATVYGRLQRYSVTRSQMQQEKHQARKA